MKRLGVFAVSLILIIGGYFLPSKALASISNTDLTNLQQFTSTFSSYDSSFGSKYASMVTSVYDRFKNDPDIDANSLRRYVLEGVPGTTIPDQQGFIPYLNGVISTSRDSDLVSKARIVLSQAQYLLNNSRIREQLAGGAITKEQADAAMLENARASTAAGNVILKDRAGEKCTSITNASIKDCIDAGFAWIIKNTLLQVAGFLAWLTANMMNYAVQTGVLEFSTWAPNSLYPIWIVVRQIVSLAIVFAGLYLGFLYIIGREDTFGRYVGWVVIFALFVNFSYPITRSIIDVSNIVSLNIYSSAIGPDALTGSTNAGLLVMNKLGLQGLVADATRVDSTQADLLSQINSVPGALMAVVFVLYAAYVFFIATAILAMRTAVLVFLTIASPLMLVDTVVPKLGDAAAKIRKMYFEQLAVAPVFMIMLALTLKFMDIFQTSGAFSTPGNLTALSGGADSVKTFFGIFMMLIMLHIMLKVTRSIAGEAGNYASNFMGKVGGFGLAAATGGAGVLARGTIGQKALQLRDSQWMDRMKDTKVGRGLYGLSNSLAQSTFDARNIGMVSKGLATAGLTGGLGLTMQSGSKRGFVQVAKDREEKVLKFGSNIRDDATRVNYFNKANRFSLTRIDQPVLDEAIKSTQKAKDDQVEKMLTTTDKKDRESLINQALIAKDYALADKLRSVNQYHEIDNTDLNAPKSKADLLKKAGVQDVETASKLIKKDPLKDLTDKHEKAIKQLQEEAAQINRKTKEGEEAYRDMQAKIGEENARYRKEVDGIREKTLAAFSGPIPENTQSPTPSGSSPNTPSSGPGGSDTSVYNDARYQTPAVFRKNGTPNPVETSPETDTARPTMNRSATPGVVMTAEDKIREREERTQASQAMATPHTGGQAAVDTTREAANQTPFNSPSATPSSITMQGTKIDLTNVKTQSFTSHLSQLEAA